MGTPPLSDAVLREAIELVEQHGTITEAAKVAGIPRETLQARYNKARLRRDLRLGAEIDNRIADGYEPTGYSQLTKTAAGEPIWIKTRRAEIDISEAIERRIAGITPRDPVRLPSSFGPDKLLNHVTIADGHVGALAWPPETGSAAWDLDIAHASITSGANWLLDNLPDAENVLIMALGDFVDTDGFAPLTPASKNLLDVDGRFPKIADVAIDALESTVAHALGRYRHVHLCIRPGNHDPLTTWWLRKLMTRIFANEPRVKVDASLQHYWALNFGKSMICAHHGDKAKLTELPAIFAADFAPQWGSAVYRVCHTGHYHHKRILIEQGREQRGMMVLQHPTISSRNAWAAEKGLGAGRELLGHTYHKAGALLTTLHYSPEIQGLEAA